MLDCRGRRLHGASAVRAAGAASGPGLGHGGPVHGVRAAHLWRIMNEAAYLTGDLRDVAAAHHRPGDADPWHGHGDGGSIAPHQSRISERLRARGSEQEQRGRCGPDEARRGRRLGAMALSLIVCVCALSTLDATIFTGARVLLRARARPQHDPGARCMGDMRGHDVRRTRSCCNARSRSC